MRERGEDFGAWLWDLAGGAPVQTRWTAMDQIPASTPASEAMAKALKARGFKFCGPVIVLRLHAGRRHGQRPHHWLLPPRRGRRDGRRRMKSRGPDMLLERACIGPVCGVDEAGRGPWAGTGLRRAR